MQDQEFVVESGTRVRLTDHDPDDTGRYKNEKEARGDTARLAEDLAKYQDMLFAHKTYGVVVVLQGMDGAGKDPLIKQMMSSANPQACKVTAFKAMTEKELARDYLRRAAEALPDRGEIGIFNRSYYEQVATDQVHPEKLDEQKLPPHLKEDLWTRRYRDIRNFERYLVDNGFVVLKFFLNMSRETQRDRLLERIAKPEKRWQFSETDIEDHGLWDEYMKVYEDVLTETSTPWAPWRVVPANNRWFTHVAVGAAVVSTLKSLHTDYPDIPEEKRQMIEDAKERLESEGE